MVSGQFLGELLEGDAAVPLLVHILKLLAEVQLLPRPLLQVILLLQDLVPLDRHTLVHVVILEHLTRNYNLTLNISS